jgi:hypothetical protein
LEQRVAAAVKEKKKRKKQIDLKARVGGKQEKRRDAKVAPPALPLITILIRSNDGPVTRPNSTLSSK